MPVMLRGESPRLRIREFTVLSVNVKGAHCKKRNDVVKLMRSDESENFLECVN